MHEPRITIVLPTYNRPDTLVAAIHSVALQTVAEWRLLVIGDHCDALTAQAVGRFPDPRIAYVNLPARCGEQATPNTVGLSVARTDLIALLNHDDLWLADHLSRGLESLDRTGADLHIARAAFGRRTLEGADGRPRVVFTETNPLGRTLAHVHHAAPFLFEPCSSWLFRRALADRVGGWTPARLIFRTPMQDWLLRAWRAGAVLHADDAVTTLKMNTHQQSTADQYAWGAAEHEELLAEMRAGSPAALRARVTADLALAAANGWPPRDPYRPFAGKGAHAAWLAERLLSPALAEVFLETGWDSRAVIAEMLGETKGAAIEHALLARTGETPREPPALEGLLAEARAQLSAHPHWPPHG